jgi:flavin reductase (DIM6/NTAB) family NADH-FMN oxidoreductase RutF
VSDQPPTLLVCLNRRSNSAPILAQNAVFCVNTLGAAEEKLADLFAGRSNVQRAERFGVGEWTTLKTGAPVLASAVVAFDCRTVEIKAVGSHNVIFGAVEAVRLGPSGSALVYHDRAYKPV